MPVTGSLRLIGLTGGIGGGKTSVARLIAAHGIPVLDADQIAREVSAPGTEAAAEIAAAWPGIVGPDGAVDRRKLAAIVFADPQARKRLEAIMHPRIAARAKEHAAALERAGHRLAFYEASLLVETGRHHDFDGLVVVTVSPETQLARALARGGLSPEQARARIAAQLPLADKVAAATHVIDNEGGLEATAAQVDQLLRAFRRD